MGISFSILIDEKRLEHPRRRCDGKSLTQYFMAYAIESEFGLNGIANPTPPRATAEDKIIRHDFRKGVASADDEPIGAGQGDTSPWIALGRYFIDNDEYDSGTTSNAKLEAIVHRLIEILESEERKRVGLMGVDLEDYRTGALQDCDDILTAIRLAKKKRVTLSMDV